MGPSNQLKGAVKQRWKNQKGLAFPLALVVLGISVLLMVPFLNGVSSGSLTSRKSVAKTFERYAADAALEDALWNLNNGSISLGSVDIWAIITLWQQLNYQTTNGGKSSGF